MSLPAPLDKVACWLLKAEGALAEEEGDPQDHGRAADDAREKQQLLKVSSRQRPLMSNDRSGNVCKVGWILTVFSLFPSDI